jgi:hypothetical protein
MKHPILITALGFLAAGFLTAAEETREEVLAKHKEGSEKVADDQDELAADVQQLIAEQTQPKVAELLREAEKIMDEATDKLSESDTGGVTLAAQTEIIEKIAEAAKEKKSGSGKSGGAMMDMMERMMGKKPDGDQKGEGKGKGDKPGDKGGEGQTGESDTANEAIAGNSGGGSEVRRVPKAAGKASAEIPEEFRKAFDAYNRGAEKKVK